LSKYHYLKIDLNNFY